jgi:hypothetical protein
MRTLYGTYREPAHPKTCNKPSGLRLYPRTAP